MTAAAMILAVAMLIGGRPAMSRVRGWARPARNESATALRPNRTRRDPLAVASALDIFAICLASGMEVSAAARATAPSAPPSLAGMLRRTADLLALGADPAIAWSLPADAVPDDQCRALFRLARRSAASGTALADGLVELAVEARHRAAHDAAAAGERAGVLIAGPLGVCFLPAFI